LATTVLAPFDHTKRETLAISATTGCPGFPGILVRSVGTPEILVTVVEIREILAKLSGTLGIQEMPEIRETLVTVGINGIHEMRETCETRGHKIRSAQSGRSGMPLVRTGGPQMCRPETSAEHQRRNGRAGQILALDLAATTVNPSATPAPCGIDHHYRLVEDTIMAESLENRRRHPPRQPLCQPRIKAASKTRIITQTGPRCPSQLSEWRDRRGLSAPSGLIPREGPSDQTEATGQRDMIGQIGLIDQRGTLGPRNQIDLLPTGHRAAQSLIVLMAAMQGDLSLLVMVVIPAHRIRLATTAEREAASARDLLDEAIDSIPDRKKVIVTTGTAALTTLIIALLEETITPAQTSRWLLTTSLTGPRENQSGQFQIRDGNRPP